MTCRGYFNVGALCEDESSEGREAKCTAVAVEETKLYSLSRSQFLALAHYELWFFDKMPPREFLLSPRLSWLRGEGPGGGDGQLSVDLDALCATFSQHSFRSVKALVRFLMDPKLGAPYAFIKAGSLAITLKMRREQVESSVTDRKVVLTRGELISMDALKALTSGKGTGAITCTITSRSITLLRIQPPDAGVDHLMAVPSSLQRVISTRLQSSFVEKLLSTMEVSGVWPNPMGLDGP